MDPILEGKLARLQNRTTLHEAVLVNRTNSVRMLFCYARKTRRGLVDYLRANDNGPALSAHSGEMVFSRTRPGDVLTIGHYSIRWSGRTQREALIEGELPFWKGGR